MMRGAAKMRLTMMRRTSSSSVPPTIHPKQRQLQHIQYRRRRTMISNNTTNFYYFGVSQTLLPSSSSSLRRSYFSTDDKRQQQQQQQRSGERRRNAIACHEVQIDNDDATTTTTTQIVQPFFDQQEPLVLRGVLLQDSKNRLAVQQNFKNWDYWETKVTAVDTTCQVEIGGKGYNSETPIVDIPFVQFLSYLRFFEERFGRRKPPQHSQQSTGDNASIAAACNDGETAASAEVPTTDDLIYLAQNDIPDEILDDITIPEFCQTLGQQTSLYSTMIWIGPYGCISPLHNDPLDNVLMQYVGAKEIFLCSPRVKSSFLKIGTDGNQKNTSPLSPKDVMDGLFLLEEEEEDDKNDFLFQETTLYPGDALYIPKKWYHHVTTVETSVSINTWFR